MLVGLAAQQDRAGVDRIHPRSLRRRASAVSKGEGRRLERVDDRAVGVEDEQAGVVGHRRGEGAVLGHRHDGLDALAVGDLLVDLTEGSGGVDHARTVGRRDRVVGGDDAEGALVAGVVGHRRCVGPAEELGAGVAADDRRLLPQLTGVVTQAGLREDVLRGAALDTGHGRLDDDVVDLGADHDGQVAREGPRGRRPDEQVGTVEDRVLAGRVHPQADGDRRVLPLLVDVVVHAQLVVGQRRLVLPAVGQHAEALVDQALVVHGLEGPDDRLHEAGVERLVVVVEVDPARLAGDVVAPVPGVLQHRLAADLVELLDAQLADLVGRLQPELAHRLELGGQPVGVPAEAPLDPLAAHRLVARDDVLDVAGEQVAVVRQPVGEGGPVVEDELIGPVGAGLASIDRGLEGPVGLPVAQDLLLEVGEAGGRDDGGRVSGGDLGVGHRCGSGGTRRGHCHEDDGWATAVPPRLSTPFARREETALGRSVVT